MEESEEPKSGLRFTLKNLFGVTTYCAIACGTITLFHEIGLLLVLVTSAIIALYYACTQDQLPSLYMCIGAVLLLFFLVPSLGPPSEAELILSDIAVGIGIWLSFNAIRYGHWSTKLVACCTFILYSLLIGGAIFGAIRNWNNIITYWTS